MITMTQQARAIAAVSLALLLVTGSLNRVALAAFSISGNNPWDDQAGRIIVSLLIVATAGGVLWFANAAAGASTPTAGWDAHLAQAARFLAVVGLAIAVLLTVGAAANQGPIVYGNFPLA